jgi:histidinol-phosphatase (PHP family)
LIRKLNGSLCFFDESDAFYRKELEKTARQASESGVIVEINTGALARNVMQDVYPSHELLVLLQKNGVPVMINSDAHTKDTIDCCFERAKECARSAGYTRTVYIADGKRYDSPL